MTILLAWALWWHDPQYGGWNRYDAWPTLEQCNHAKAEGWRRKFLWNWTTDNYECRKEDEVS